MPKKFTLDFLNKTCNEKNIDLLKDYSDDELNSQKFIEFVCTDCKQNTSKKFEFIIKYDPLCKNCSKKKSIIKYKHTIFTKYGVENISQVEYIKTKKKETTIKNYGVEHNSQSHLIKNKKIETTIKNHGVEHPTQSQEVKNKCKTTCLKKYGVEYPSQSKELQQKSRDTSLAKFGSEYASQTGLFKMKVKETWLKSLGVSYPMQSQEVKNKSKITYMKNFGVDHPMKNQEFKNKIRQIILEKYGVEYYSQTKDCQDKIKDTCFKKYGVEHPQQNSEIAEKTSKKCYKSKLFIFPSGNEIKCQGYEPFALSDLIKNNIDEIDIKTGAKNVPTIWYNDPDGKKHRHYVDIFIPSQNKCIEVKSTWTAEKKKDCIFFKQKAAKELGYEYEIWIYDNKGNKIIRHL
jgi:hypothetical protein